VPQRGLAPIHGREWDRMETGAKGGFVTEKGLTWDIGGKKSKGGDLISPHGGGIVRRKKENGGRRLASTKESGSHRIPEVTVLKGHLNWWASLKANTN